MCTSNYLYDSNNITLGSLKMHFNGVKWVSKTHG